MELLYVYTYLSVVKYIGTFSKKGKCIVVCAMITHLCSNNDNRIVHSLSIGFVLGGMDYTYGYSNARRYHNTNMVHNLVNKMTPLGYKT